MESKQDDREHVDMYAHNMEHISHNCNVVIMTLIKK